MGNKKLEIRLDGYTQKYVSEWKDLGIEFLLYAQCYEEALTAILRNIDYNKSTESSAFVGMEEEYIPPLDSSNIIAFIGSRGSGKTTAVNGFSKVLSFYHNNAEKWNSRLVYKIKNNSKYLFHVLAPIDASVLEAKEDLMEVILASMYQAFEKKAKEVMNRSDTVRRMVKEFNDAYQSYLNVAKNNDKRNLYEETSLAKLKDISNSLKTKSTISELTENFLKLLDSEEGSSVSYLVVVIDDLDMNPVNGFAMLEQLHKYWSNQRIIILIAIKYEQMKLMCNQHFVDCLTPRYGGVHKEIFDKFYAKAKELSSDYLLKVIPLPNRIYMPENMLSENGTIIKRQQENQAEDEVEIKTFILDKIAARMNIFYDAIGLKRHFCLPDTVRELVSYSSFLDSLHSMEEIERCDKEKRIVLYDQNYEWFNGDIENRMAIRILNDEQLEVYRLIQERNIERRAKYAVNFLRSWMENGRTMDDNVEGQVYCYADLLKTIYELGRKEYSDKVLVHCILASFTTAMVREYYHYMNCEDQKSHDCSARRLQCFLGNTFGGEWFEEVMPQARSLSETTSKINMGYIPNVNMIRLDFDISKSITPEIENNSTKVILCFLADIVPCMERLMLLFSNYRDKYGIVMKPLWKFEMRTGETEEGYGVSLRIASETSLATYDIYGFIGKEIEEEAEKNKKNSSCEIIKESLIEPLVNCLKSKLQGLNFPPDEIEVLLEQLRTEIGQKSIWSRQSKDMEVSVPFYNLDMTYNVMKRVRKKLKENPSLGEAEAYDYLCIAYTYLAEELYKEDEAYRKIPEQEPPHFFNNFVNSPFIQAFDIRTDKKELPVGNDIQQTSEIKDKMRSFFNEAIQYMAEDITPDIMRGVDMTV